MRDERLTIVSADCHAGPRLMGDYRPYIEARFLADFDDYCARIDRFETEIGSGLEGGGAPSYGETGLWDSEARTHSLDGDGVAAEVIFAQGSVAFHAYPAVGGGQKVDFHASAEQIAAGCRAYNRWLADLCARDPKRHLGIARVPLPDVEAAVAEVEWAAKNGLRGGVHLPPVTSAEALPYFNDPIYERFWAACATNNMALNMHGGANLAYGPGPESFALTLAEVDWLSHRGLSHLIFSGVFERYPNLHLAMTEQRNHWVHQLLDDFELGLCPHRQIWRQRAAAAEAQRIFHDQLLCWREFSVAARMRQARRAGRPYLHVGIGLSAQRGHLALHQPGAALCL